MDEGDLRKLITSYLFYCTSCAEQFKSTSSEAAAREGREIQVSAIRIFQAARNLTFLRQNIKWSIIFLTNSTFERNLVSTHHRQIGEEKRAGEKKTCQKLDFLVQNTPLFERFQENRSHSILNNFDISTTFAGVEKLSDNKIRIG